MSAAPATPGQGTVEADWEALVAGALLGTDRRPPALPARYRVPGLAGRDPAELTLAAAALLGGQRTAGRLPQPTDRPPVPPAPPLGYRVCTPTAAGLVHYALAGSDPVWPALIEQWTRAARAEESGPPGLMMMQLAEHPAFAAHAALAAPFLDWWQALPLDGQLTKLTWRRQPAAIAHVQAASDRPWDRARTYEAVQHLLRAARSRAGDDEQVARTDAARQVVLRGTPELLNPYLDPLTVLFPLAGAVISYRDRLMEEFPRAETEI